MVAPRGRLSSRTMGMDKTRMRWNQHQLETRDTLTEYFTRFYARELGKVNNAFRFLRIESPTLIPYSVNESKAAQVSIQFGSETFSLREDTATGAYEASREILAGKGGIKQRLPIVVYQHGKVFVKTEKGLRERHHLEYQILYSKTTGMTYDEVILQSCSTMLRKQCGKTVEMVDGDRHIILDTNKNILARVRHRDDFWAGNNIEIMMNMDAIVVAAIAEEKVMHTRKPSKRS